MSHPDEDEGVLSVAAPQRTITAEVRSLNGMLRIMATELFFAIKRLERARNIEFIFSLDSLSALLTRPILFFSGPEGLKETLGPTRLELLKRLFPGKGAIL